MVIEKLSPPAAPSDSYDVVKRCLRVGLIAQAYPTEHEALAHVGAPRESKSKVVDRPINRAEWRAAARRRLKVRAS